VMCYTVELSVQSKSLQRVFADTEDLLAIRIENNSLTEKVADPHVVVFYYKPSYNGVVSHLFHESFTP